MKKDRPSKTDFRRRYMSIALELAARAEDHTYPNPMVGAVIVNNGKIIGKGYHKKAGRDHAEVCAIKDANGNLKGAEMYVTLEPCSHYGNTPPCVDAIISSGISKVYIAMIDPNPVTSRLGINKLKRTGIEVEVGICGRESMVLNEKYIKFMTENLPYVTIKSAQTLDGKIAARNGSSKWITSEASRRYGRKLRSRFTAVIAGINTVLKDDPELLSGGKNKEYTSRIVVDSRLRLPLRSKLVKTSGIAPLVVATTEKAPASKIKALGKISGIKVVRFKSSCGVVPVKQLLKKLAAMGHVSVLVEGGGELIGSFLERSLIDEWMFYIAPLVIGGDNSSVKGRGVPDISKALKFDYLEQTNIGKDIFLRAKVCSRV